MRVMPIAGLAVLTAALALTPRTAFGQLAALLTVWLVLYGWIVGRRWGGWDRFAALSPMAWVAVGLALRAIWLAMQPEALWSEDWLRYAWDGWLTATGENPYRWSPRIWAEGQTLSPALHHLLDGMNSPDYRAIYPPLAQYAFAALHLPERCLGLGPNPTAWWWRWRVLLWAVEGVILYRLARREVRWGALYALHPLAIAEVVGNGHLDGLVMGFVVMAFTARSGKTAAAALGAGVLTKVFPLLLLPAWWQHRPRVRRVGELALGTGMVALLAAPLALSTGGFAGAWESAGLFTSSFEFNASLYFIARAIGTVFVGHNPIAVLGPVLLALGMLVATAVGLGWGRARTLSVGQRGLAAFVAVLCCATTVHPWYLLYVLVLGVWANAEWAVLAGFTALMSYGAYGEVGDRLGPWLSVCTYGPPFAWGLWTWFRARRAAGSEVT